MKNKLEILSEVEGMSIEELLEEGILDSVCKGICTNPGCSYTTEVEPDCGHGYCEICDTQTVSSALVLGGLI